MTSELRCSGGIYTGQQGREDLPSGGQRAFSTASYTREEVERIAHAAFGLARQRKRQLVSVDLANYLEVSVFWREVGLFLLKLSPGQFGFSIGFVRSSTSLIERRLELEDDCKRPSSASWGLLSTKLSPAAARAQPQACPKCKLVAIGRELKEAGKPSPMTPRCPLEMGRQQKAHTSRTSCHTSVRSFSVLTPRVC